MLKFINHRYDLKGSFTVVSYRRKNYAELAQLWGQYEEEKYRLSENAINESPLLQHIEYHIFGDGRHFLGVHPELSAISDPVIFHGEPWYGQIPLLEEAAARFFW